MDSPYARARDSLLCNGAINWLNLYVRNLDTEALNENESIDMIYRVDQYSWIDYRLDPV